MALLLLFGSPSFAAMAKDPLFSIGGWKTHDMEPLGPTTFRVLGADPYIYSTPFSQPLQSIAGVLLDLSIDGNPGMQPMQMYFATDDRGWSEALSFRFTPPRDGKAFIPLHFYEGESIFPDGTSMVNLRLDVNRCESCILKVREAVLIQSATSELAAMMPTDLSEPDLPVLKPIAPDISQKGSWVPHDIEILDGNLFRVTGGDPFIESPDLDVLLSKVEGIHFRLQFLGERRYQKMQLFWTSYSHPAFDEKSSILFNAVMQNDVADMYIPLRGELPRNEVLKKIRLDLMDAPGVSFRILAARLVDRTNAALLQRIPVDLVYFPKIARYSKRILLFDVLQRLKKNTAFLFFLGLLMVGTAAAMVWLWRSGGHLLLSSGKPPDTGA